MWTQFMSWLNAPATNGFVVGSIAWLFAMIALTVPIKDEHRP